MALAEGWQESVPDYVGQDDRCPPCQVIWAQPGGPGDPRREYWIAELVALGGGYLPDRIDKLMGRIIVREDLGQILSPMRLEMGIFDGLHVFTLATSAPGALRITGSGRSAGDAVADLMVKLELWVAAQP
jgi:hypothetical protein